MNFENLQIGTLGWQHQSWSEVFYPADMPEDWQLDFYANQYKTLLVNEEVWLGWDADALQEVDEALPEHFALYLQVDSELTEDKLTQLKVIKSVLQDKLVGLVVFSEFGDIANHYADIPVTLVSTQHELCGWSWSVESDYVCSGAPCGVLQSLTTDARQQTEVLKSFMQSLPKGALGAPLIVCGGEASESEIDVAQLNSLKTIAELMGY